MNEFLFGQFQATWDDEAQAGYIRIRDRESNVAPHQLTLAPNVIADYDDKGLVGIELLGRRDG